MKTQRLTFVRSRLLAGGLALAMAVSPLAFAGGITPAQRDKIKEGMTMDEVKKVLGAPNQIVRVRYSPGPTWVYETNTGGSLKHFEVDFDGSGKAMWIQQHDLPGGG